MLIFFINSLHILQKIKSVNLTFKGHYTYHVMTVILAIQIEFFDGIIQS